MCIVFKAQITYFEWVKSCLCLYVITRAVKRTISSEKYFGIKRENYGR